MAPVDAQLFHQRQATTALLQSAVPGRCRYLVCVGVQHGDAHPVRKRGQAQFQRMLSVPQGVGDQFAGDEFGILDQPTQPPCPQLIADHLAGTADRGGVIFQRLHDLHARGIPVRRWIYTSICIASQEDRGQQSGGAVSPGQKPVPSTTTKTKTKDGKGSKKDSDKSDKKDSKKSDKKSAEAPVQQSGFNPLAIAGVAAGVIGLAVIGVFVLTKRR